MLMFGIVQKVGSKKSGESICPPVKIKHAGIILKRYIYLTSQDLVFTEQVGCVGGTYCVIRKGERKSKIFTHS